jgi:hypothetical protein
VAHVLVPEPQIKGFNPSYKHCFYIRIPHL